MFKLLTRLNKKQLLCVLICAALIALQVWLDLKLPDYMSEITTILQTVGSKTKDILIPGSKMLLCAFGTLVLSVIVGYFASYIAATFSKNLRSDVFKKVGDFSMEEIKKFSTSSLITRTTNDITQVQMILSMGLQVIIKAPIMAVWAVIKILNKNLTWSMVTALAILVLLVMLGILLTLALPKFKIIQSLTDNLNKITRENLTGIRVVRAFNAEDYQNAKFNKANDDLTKTHLYTQRLMSILSPSMSFVMSTLTLLIYFIGAYLINEAVGLDKIGLFSDMVVFSSYAMQVVAAFIMLSLIFVIYPRASVSAKRILEILEEEVKIKSGNVKKSITDMGNITFNNVSFKYPDAEEYMLENISFDVKKGETVAFIGSTGSGKSTLINLIPRFYDVTDGNILVGGVNVKDYDLEYLYNNIGYISQKAVLFSGSVIENVNYGKNGKKNPTLKEIKEAVKIAEGDEFVSSMENGYESHIAQGGTNISGGQKQRLSIARAIVRNPKIYIFDDSFSALDYKTDYKLRKNLKEHTKDATILIVAQRIGTIKNADKIIVLDNGRMVGMGTHKELLKNCNVYKEIALSQISKEELENA